MKSLSIRSYLGPKVLAFVIFAFSFSSHSSCIYHSPRTGEVQEQFPETVLIIGHRGTKALAPENTMSAFRLATKYGHGFELDTMQCKSGELVVIHDYNLERVTGVKKDVKETSLQEIKDLDAGSRFSPKFKGEKIPTLEEVLDEFGGKAVIDIEIKSKESGEAAQKLADEVVSLLQKKKFPKRTFVSSFNPKILERIKEKKPELIRAQIYGTFKDSDIEYYKKVVLRNLLLNKRAVPDILAPEKVLVDEKYIREYHALGYKILPWTVNDPEEMKKLLKAKVDGLITDRPDLFAKIVEEETQSNRKGTEK
ncbi:glycerophosphodiester phosphodiesterase [Leptospira perolatii]|uniref:Glycerophosphodiester phosphodiesterase n=1 Tax=Leptospira perolatii TaxID=2023191 RepID=A0A2M9ZPM9_9LEPT|nr:glycerophosphodiester phosphodiesterase family protein [Leptospira perolatii]PJZ70898.1 glycerophosphodiester phosphodiesterase [Leptospira perolatii]PJZ74028.1 glycerophosphodiester phosphodiesterase [Leptospira perolatii]